MMSIMLSDRRENRIFFFKNDDRIERETNFDSKENDGKRLYLHITCKFVFIICVYFDNKCIVFILYSKLSDEVGIIPQNNEITCLSAKIAYP